MRIELANVLVRHPQGTRHAGIPQFGLFVAVKHRLEKALEPGFELAARCRLTESPKRGCEIAKGAVAAVDEDDPVDDIRRLREHFVNDAGSHGMAGDNRAGDTLFAQQCYSVGRKLLHRERRGVVSGSGRLSAVAPQRYRDHTMRPGKPVDLGTPVGLVAAKSVDEHHRRGAAAGVLVLELHRFADVGSFGHFEKLPPRVPCPPSTLRTVPETYAARSEAMKVITSATSSTVAARPFGIPFKYSRQPSSDPVSALARVFMSVTRRSVSTGPGLTARTRIPSSRLYDPSALV